MIQIALIAVAIGLIILGVKGFTQSGLAFSKKTTLRGTPAKIVGSICIVAGVAIIPVFMLVLWMFSI